MKKYKSKIDTGLVLIVVAIIIIGLTPFILIHDALLAGLSINGIIILMFVDMVMNTEYVIDGKILRVKCGCLIRHKCDIMDITSVRPTRTLVSSPAMSLDRLELKLRDRDIVISPKDKVQFINDLCAVNPNIKVES